ncbi:IclR family transcriptional regulator [Rhodobacteraceae bacterium]|nr:IclR family transcriptional regulator [Paracoccaceae bacterium]
MDKAPTLTRNTMHVVHTVVNFTFGKLTGRLPFDANDGFLFRMRKILEKKYTAPALDKGLDIIELLATQDVGLSQSDIARRLDRTVGEIFRMLMVLESRGYVAQDQITNRYVLTTRLFELAHKTPNVRRLSAIAGPIISALAREIEQSVHLTILANESVLVIAQVDSPLSNVMSVRLGSSIPIWTASSGRVIIAFRPEHEIQQLVKDFPLPEDMTEEQIFNDLATIRENKGEIRNSFMVSGVVNIAKPIFDISGHSVAAITIPHIERFGHAITFEQCVAAITKTAENISRLLGAGSRSI